MNFEYTLVDDIAGEREDRLTNTKTFPYGLSFLDDALGGFSAGEIVLIGSKTGLGKSQFCNILAETNAVAGNKGLFIALEAEPREIGRRLKFRRICRDFYSENINYKYPLSYNKWRRGELEDRLSKYEDCANKYIESIGTKLIVKYRHKDFVAEDIENLFIQYHNEVDYIILDHLHYVDMFEINENVGLKRIIKTIRNANIDYKIPIILVVHLRKTDKRLDGLVPEEEDIHGSSDIPKIGTTTILFSPEFNCSHEYITETYFRIHKSRGDSTVKRYIAKMAYDQRYQEYKESYELGAYKPFAKEMIEPKVYPEWYRGKFEF
jgi:hypothetical protein